MAGTCEAQVQIRLLTKQHEYAVPDIPLSVPVSIDLKGLNELVNHLLKESQADLWKLRDFDFLAGGELIRVPLIEHLQERNLSLEATVDVEYIQVTPAPEPQDAILHDDWVASLHSCSKWILVGCYDYAVYIRTSHGNQVACAKNHRNIVKSVKWLDPDHPENGFVTVSHDQTGIIWAWEEGTDQVVPKVQLRGHEKGIDSVNISPNSKRIASGGWDTNLKIWSASLDDTDSEPANKKSRGGSNSSHRSPLHTLSGHKEAVSSINWIDNYTIQTASMDHTIKFWDAELCGIKNELIDQKAFLGSSWSNLSNTLLAASADRHIRLYDPRSTEGALCKTTFTSHTLWVSSVCWSRYDPHLFMSGSYDSTVKVWDTRSPKAPLYNLQGHEGQVLTVDWSNDKYLMSGGTDNHLHIFKNKQFT